MHSLWFLGVVGISGSAAPEQNFASDTGRRSPTSGSARRTPETSRGRGRSPCGSERMTNNAVVSRELLRAKRPADRVPVKTVGKTRAKI